MTKEQKAADQYAQNTPDEAEETVQDQAEAEEVPELELTDEELVALCKARVCPACNEKQEADNERLRNLAEMDNFKKRLAREQDDFRKYAAEKVLADLLPILDNLDLALLHGGNDDACKNLIMGVDMTRKLFLDTLKQHGLEPVGAVGDEFSPELHEAMGNDEESDLDTNHVTQVMQRGYKLGERLLRPAKVMVAK